MDVMGVESSLHGWTLKNPIYSPNSKKLSFICDYTGVPQVWEFDRAIRRPAHSHFSTKERVTFISYISGTSNLIIGMDASGNEMVQLYMLTADGRFIALTNSPEHVHQYGGSSPDGKWIAWSSNRRNPAFLDIYIQNLETLDIRLVYSGNGRFSAIKWSPDGGALLVKKTNTPLDQDLGILDLSTENMFLITEHKGEAGFKNAHFNKNGDHLYVLTNKDREFFGIAIIEISTKKMEWIAKGKWDFENLTINKEKNKLAFTMNQDGISKGFLLDLNQNALFSWDTPMGVISNLTFSPDNKKLAFAFSGPAYRPDICEINLSTIQVERLTYFSGTADSRQRLIEPYRISYPSFDGLPIPAFYYKPINGKEKPPVIILIHGGPEAQARASYSPMIQYFLNQGFAVCAPNIRGSTGYGKSYTHLDDGRKRMDAVKDLVYLVKWLKEYGGIDSKKIVIMGGSYGGFLTLASICHYPTLWSAAITIAGFPSIKTFLQTTHPLRRKLREAEYGSIEENEDFFNKIDPLNHTEKISIPLMVIHGANDSRVSIKEIEKLVHLLKKRKHPVQFIRFEDEGHSLSKPKNKEYAYTSIVSFLKGIFKMDRF